MKKQIFAGLLALAALGMLCAGTHADEFGVAVESQLATNIDIARVKSVLRLTAEQERYWPPVEAALRDIARRQAKAEPSGFVRRISHHVVAIALNGAAVSRLANAARPLIASLRDDQKQGAMALAQEMGLGPVLAALN